MYSMILITDSGTGHFRRRICVRSRENFGRESAHTSPVGSVLLFLSRLRGIQLIKVWLIEIHLYTRWGQPFAMWQHCDEKGIPYAWSSFKHMHFSAVFFEKDEEDEGVVRSSPGVCKSNVRTTLLPEEAQNILWQLQMASRFGKRINVRDYILDSGHIQLSKGAKMLDKFSFRRVWTPSILW